MSGGVIHVTRTSAMGLRFNRSMQHMLEIVVLVFRS
jgi:hypothetical protein